MNRRKFISSITSATFAALGPGSCWANPSGSARNQAVLLRVNDQKDFGEIAPDFLGLGYEISSVARPGLLSAKNLAYLQFVRGLGTQGVIRVGGNTSDYAHYSKDGPAVSSPRNTVIDESAIRDLADFLDATGWKLIWGLNLGSGPIENSIREAQAVVAAAKDKLLAMEIGNEPDLFGGGVAHRPKGYGYSAYLQEYRVRKAALRAKLPDIPLAGPDVAARTDWLTQFASDEGPDLKLLTHHYYAEGPPDNPASTIGKLLQTDEKLGRILRECESSSRRANIPYRICETNSCFGGGKPGVSDTFASALWGLDFLFTLAAANAAGANIETGVNQLGFISSYSPIGEEGYGNYRAKPLYYGMLAFARAARGRKIAIEDTQVGINLKAYAVADRAHRLTIIIINKEGVISADVTLVVPAKGRRGSILRLAGPGLDSKDGVTLGGSAVGADGKWTAMQTEAVVVKHGECRLHLPNASAAILTLEA